MIRSLLSLVFFSVLVFAGGLLVARAFGEPRTPPVDGDTRGVRKSGDMILLWHGRTYHTRSHRLGSVGSRSYRGGGLHGGK